MSLRRRALFLAGIFVAVSCSDAGNPLEPGPKPDPDPESYGQALQCTVAVSAGSMRCALPEPNTGGASGQIQLGGVNGQYVELAATNFLTTPTDLSFQVTVKNLLLQPLGTADSTTLDPAGVRVWLTDDVVVAMPAGTANVDAAAATADSTRPGASSSTPYLRINEILDQDETSTASTHRFRFTHSGVGTTDSVRFWVYVVAKVPHPNGWVEITPPEASLTPGGTVDLDGIAYHRQAPKVSTDQNLNWVSNRPGVASVDPTTGVVTASSTADSLGVVTITATNDHAISGTATIVVNSPVQAVTDSVDALGNVTISYPASIGLLENDTDADSSSQTLSVIPGIVPTAEGGTANLAADGSFTYITFPGFIGKDTIPYVVTDGLQQDSGVAIVNVTQRYWYVQPSAASGGTGTDAAPFNTLAAAGPVSSGDVILVRGGGDPAAADAGITLDDGQHLIGQGIAADVTATLMGGVVSLTLLDGTGVSPKVAGTVTVGQNNTIRGVQIDAASGAAIAGTGFGTLSISEQVILNPGAGPALNLTNGALNSADVFSLSSTNSASTGLSLTNVTGSLTANGGAISGATGAAVVVDGGSVSVTYGGNVTKGSAGSLLSVTGSHTGTLAFNGALSATAGDGLQFNAAGGTYNFNGTTTLNGGDAGVDITNGSAGTFSFGTGTGITSPTGSAFTVYGSSPVVTYSGNITKGNAGLLVEIGEQPGGSVTFNTGTLQATAGDGISLSNADGANSFNGTTTLNGGDAGVDVVSQSSGAISFGTGASIANASGIALRVANGGASTSVTFAGPITASATGLAAHVEGVSAGAVLLSGAISGANGIVAQNNTGGTITFSGTKSLSTGAGNAVTLTSNTGATISFTNGNTDLTTTTGTAFSATGGGTVNVSGAGSDINTTGGTGPALTLNGVTLGASGMEFATVNTGAALAPVTLTNVGVTSGSAITVGGGSIPAANGTRFAVSGGSVNVNWAGSISQSTHNAALLSVAGGHSGTLAFSGAISATSGNGLQFDNSDGVYNFTSTVTLNGGDAGIDVTNGSAGTFTFPTATNITSPSTGNLISILNSAPNFTYSGGLTKANNNVTGILISNNTGGTITFNGDATAADGDPADVARSISSGTAAAVNLSTNGSATINFNGGGLNITSTSGAGFTATGGGTINITGAGNVISSGTGTALNVQNTTIGLSGLSFASVSHTGGATGNGIVLDNTGANNGVQVTGTGGVAGTGGSITNTQGADGSTQGAGIYLNNTRAISLAFMALSGHQNWAIRGNNVVGFTMNKVRITGTNGTSTATDDGSVYFTELTGTASITGSFIDGGFEDGVLVDNTSGTLNRITFDGDTIGSSSGISGDGMRLEASGSAVLNATVQNTRFARAAGDMFQHNIIGSAQSDLDFLNNTLINGHPAISGGGGGVTITAAESGDLTYDISGNTIRGSKGVALVVNKPFGGLPGNGTMSGFIRNNVIGTAGATQNGSSEGSGMLIGLLAQGTHTTRIEDNQIYDYEEMGIFFNIGGTSQSVTGLTHNGTVNATVVGNIIAEPLNLAGALAQNGIHLNAGTNSTGGNDAYQVCMDIGNAATAADRNTMNGSGAAGGTDFRLRQRFATTVRLPGYAGANNDNAAVVSYVQNRNNNSGITTGAAANTVPTGGGFVNPGATCPQP